MHRTTQCIVCRCSAEKKNRRNPIVSMVPPLPSQTIQHTINSSLGKMVVASFCFVFLFIWCECVDTCITRHRFKFHRSNPLSFALQMQTQIHFMRAHHVTDKNESSSSSTIITKNREILQMKRIREWKQQIYRKSWAHNIRIVMTKCVRACVCDLFDCAPLNVQFVVISFLSFFFSSL